jgi:hypothetical protein
VNTQIRPELIDDLMETYLEWREECIALRQAYERWSSGPVAERELSFAAYGAALDREQRASAVYADRFNLIASELVGGLEPEARLVQEEATPQV